MKVRPLLVLALCTLAACAKDISDSSGFASGGSATASATGASATGGSADATGADTSDSAGDASSTGATTEASLSGAEDSTSDTAVVSGTESEGDTTAGSASGETEAGSGTAGEGSSSSTGPGETSGTALDPELDVPDRGESCTTPGSLGECPALEVCRFYTAEEGRCETCDNCGNLNAPCSEGTDCDILFACFAGRCTNICPLGTSSCGPVENCLDVGHPSHGVCDPFA